eukprot:Opistho-2@68038
MLALVFFPLVTVLLLVALIIWWMWVAIYLATASEATYIYRNTSGTFGTCDPNLNATGTGAACVFDGYKTNTRLRGMQVYHLFGLFWTSNFIIALGQTTIAGAIATYYFQRKNMPFFPILGAMKRTLIYNLGSLAFGSLLIAIVQLIRAIFEYIDKQTKDKQNLVAKFVMCCCRCCLWCLEKFIKLLCKNAYIEIAIYGYSFCTAARTAFKLLARNCLRLVAVDKVGDFLLFLGHVSVVAATGVLSYQFFKTLQNDLNYYMGPVVIIIIFSYFVSKAFFSVFDMAIDTIFLCFCEDCERNDGSAEKPYHMSKSLMKILKYKNKSTSE